MDVQDPDVVVVAAGPGPRVVVPRAATVIAADGGLERAAALGLTVDIAVGDFDSASPAAVVSAQAAGARIDRHPASKDATDLELALDEAVATGARSVLVVGSAEGRLDHLLAGALLLASERYAAFELDALVGDAVVHVVRRSRELVGAPGELLTLIAVGGPAEAVSTRGLVYPLTDETLAPGSTRGVSNVFARSEVSVTLARGVLLAVRPGAGA
jgi:thiamine pyrophosphokinase